MTTWKLGINTCFAVKRWPLPGEWARIAREELGLRFVQHSLDLVDVQGAGSLMVSEAESVREACSQFEIELDSTFTGLAAYSSNMLLDPRETVRSHWEDWLNRVMDFTAAAGGNLTGGHLGAFSVNEWTDRDQRARGWQRFREALNRLRLRAKALGLEGIYVENMATAREPSTMTQLEDLLSSDTTDEWVPLLLCLDVGHECVSGSTGPERDPYAWAEHFGSRVGCVHLQQSDAEGDHHWPFTATYNELGRIDGQRLLGALEASGAEEVKLILEVIHPFEEDDGQVLADLRDSVNYWQEAIASRAARQP